MRSADVSFADLQLLRRELAAKDFAKENTMFEPVGEWKKIGEIGVDSGQMMLVDPCYIKKDWDEDFAGRPQGPAPEGGWPLSYAGACKTTLAAEACGVLEAGAAAVCSSGFGDGLYPVYVREEQGRIAAMKIEFMEEEDDDYDE